MSKLYSIHFTEAAEQDLTGIVTYIMEQLQEPDAASNTYSEIRRQINNLQQTPKRIPLVRDARLAHDGYRVIHAGNYHVFFVVGEDESAVTIVRILYARRNWADIL